MHTVIYGRPGCPFCVKARQIADYLKNARDDFSYEYIDMIQAGVSKGELSEKAGKPVYTVPQVFLDDSHIGGCDDFEAYTMARLLPKEQVN